MNNSLKKSYIINGSDVDYAKRYTLCALLRHFHDAVDFHALELQVDANTVYEKYGAYWIISHIRVDMDDTAKWHDVVEVDTYPLAPGAVRMEREAVMTTGGKPLARLSSEWVLLDNATGRPRRPLQTGYPLSLVHREGRAAGEYTRFSPEFDDTDFAYGYTVKVSDLDMNVHMNNTAYVRLACDAFGSSELDEKRMTSFEIAFKAQSYEGDELKLYRASAGENKYYVSAFKTDGTRVFDTLFTFV